MIGNGYMARKHCSALANHPSVKFHSLIVSDQNKNGESFKNEFGFKVLHNSSFGGLSQALRDNDIDIVFITSPNSLHCEQILLSLENNKHIFCEKPLAYTKNEFQNIKEAFKKNNNVLQSGMNCRFREQFSIPKMMADNGELGKLKYVRATYIFDVTNSFGDKPWWKEYPIGIYPFLHTGAIHSLDLLRWIGGEIKHVSAFGNGFELEKQWGSDNFTINVEFQSGAIGGLTCSASANRSSDFSLEVWGTEASIVGGDLYRKTSHTKEQIEIRQEKLDLVLQYENMIQAIENKTQPMNSFDEALKNFELITAIEDSVKAKKTILLK